MPYVDRVSICAGLTIATWILVTGVGVFAGQDAAWLPFEHKIAGTVANETGEPVSDAIIEIVSDRLPEYRRTANSDGHFLLTFRSDEKQRPPIRVSRGDGELFHIIPPAEPAVRRILRIVLRPPRDVEVHVTDSFGAQVAGARVTAVIGGMPVVSEHSAADGIATLSLPVDASVDWIVAYRAGRGLDYFENYQSSLPNSRRLLVPQRIDLKLDGSQPRRFRVVDDSGVPVSGIRVAPLNLWRFDKLASISLERFSDMGVSSENGEVTLGWMPHSMPHRVQFSVCHPDYSWSRRDVPSGETIQVDRVGSISGKVRQADGTPVAGIHVLAAGWHPWTGHSFRGHVVTDDDGSYRMSVWANHDALIAVADKDWAAESLPIAQLEPGEHRQVADLMLERGTLIHGTVRAATIEQRPANDVVRLGELRGKTRLVRTADVNSNGRYSIRTGPGRFTLNTAFSTDVQRLDISDQRTVQADLHVRLSARKSLVVRLVDSVGAPVSDGRVFCMPIRQRDGVGRANPAVDALRDKGERFQAASGADGSFEVECLSIAMRLYGYSRQECLAGTLHVDKDATEATLRLLPAATVTGEVRDRNEQWIAKNPVELNVELQFGEESMSCSLTTATDAMGRYQFPGVLPGATCRPYAVWMSRSQLGSSRRTVAGDEQLISKPEWVELAPLTIVEPAPSSP
jgi:hypothetical protein